MGLGDAVNEETLVVTVELSSGRDWAWYADLNMVGLGAHLDEAGREQALTELQAAWRRGFICVVPGPSPDDGVTSDKLVG